MKLIEIYTKDNCPWCEKAKELLISRYEERVVMTFNNLSVNENLKKELLERAPGVKTVPQIFIDEKHIGGYDELVEYIDNTTSLG